MAITATLLGSGTTGGSPTSGGTSTSGARFAIAIAWDAGQTITSVVDSKGNSYSAVGTPQADGQGGLCQWYFSAGGSSGSSHTATVSFSGSAFPSISFYQITDGASSAHSGSAQGQDSGGQPFVLTSGTMPSGNWAALALCSNNTGSDGAYSANASTPTFTLLHSEGTVSSFWTHGVSWASSSGAGAVTPSFNRSGTAGSTTGMAILVIEESAGGPAPTVDQAGFRFGADDAAESAHTWLAAQDANLTRAMGSAFLLRYLLQAAGDQASFAPTLRYEKNGAGGYKVVPIGPPASNIASVGTMGTGTSSSSSTSIATTTATNSLAAGDTCILVCATDNTTTTDGNSNDHTACSDNASAGTWEKLYEYTNGEGAAGSGITVSVWMLYATAALATGSVVTVTLGTARTDKVTSLWKFTSGFKLRLATAATGNVTDASNGFGSVNFSGLSSLQRLYFRGLGKEANSTTGITVSTSFTNITAQRSRNNAAAVLVRGEFRINTSTGETSNPTLAVSGDTAGVWVALEETPPDVFVAASSNIAAGGEATTQRLTGGTGSFLTGRRWDNENGSDSLDPSTDENTEVEWSLNTQAPAVDGDYFDFRVYSGSSALSSYGQTPRLTIGTPATPSLLLPQSLLQRIPALRRM